MMQPLRIILRIASCLALVLIVAAQTSGAVIVESVLPGSAAEKSGIKQEDRLLSWSFRSASGTDSEEGLLNYPWDLWFVEFEKAPLGTVQIRIQRNLEKLSVAMPLPDCADQPCYWGLRTYPELKADEQNEYLRTKELPETEQVKIWQERARLSDQPQMSAWFHMLAARAQYESGNPQTAEGTISEAIQILTKTDVMRAELMRMEWVQRWEDAESVGRIGSAVQEIQTRLPGSLLLARTQLLLAKKLFDEGNFQEASEPLESACNIFSEKVPNALEEAWCLAVTGILNFSEARFKEAAESFARSLSIHERLVANGLLCAWSLNNLGLAEEKQGYLAQAEEHYHRALAIYQEKAPVSLMISTTLLNLGNVSLERGDYAAAEKNYREALGIELQLDPSGLNSADLWSNLAIVAYHRKDYKRSEDYYRKSMEIFQQEDPEGEGVAFCLGGIAQLYSYQSQFQKAIEHHQAALSIQQKKTEKSLDVAFTLSGLGVAYAELGELDRALEYHAKALNIFEELAPESLMVAESLNNFAYVHFLKKDFKTAQQQYQRTLQLRQLLAPGSIWEAESLHDLGLVQRELELPTRAISFFDDAVRALETQSGRVGGAEEVRSGFVATFRDYYRDLLEALLFAAHKEEAFDVLERSRARSLLSMIAERDIVWEDVPPELDKERRLADSEYDNMQAMLKDLNPRQQKQEVESLRVKMREAREKQAEIADRIRTASPRLGSLRYPSPLNASSIQKSLDPGTILLTYTTGKKNSYLFTASSTQKPEVYAIPAGEEELRVSVETLRTLIQRLDAGPAQVATMRKEASRLFDLLVAPAAASIESARRVLIIPDGPLHLLPFSALIRTHEGKEQYFVEWKPIHIAISGTLFAEIRKQRGMQKEGGTILAAFGDPVYSAEAGEITLRDMRDRGYRLDPLPSSREEVNSIAALFPSSRVYTGADATEENARSATAKARYVHFACHGILDKYFPLNSALALSLPNANQKGRENGLLQAWEILERMRLHADLVTLSACETALGKDMGGEGLMGLTRAFHYAGARSVVASLWRIADETTAELMKEFYRRLRDGESKDEALRHAQMMFLQKPLRLMDKHGNARDVDASNPFFWAAFQLSGDWM